MMQQNVNYKQSAIHNVNTDNSQTFVIFIYIWHKLLVSLKHKIDTTYVQHFDKLTILCVKV